MADDDTGKEKAHDVALVHGLTEDGAGLRVLRSRPDRLELAVLRPAREGQPLAAGELVRLLPRDASPLLWDVEVLYHPGDEETAESGAHRARSGPVQVATNAYRRNWEEVFSSKSKPPPN